MPRPLYPFICFLVLFFLATCEEEEPDPDPSVNTLAVAEISSAGATFHAELIKANQQITEHGFFWSRDPNAPLGLSDKKDLGQIAKSGKFSFRLESTLEPNHRYFVRAYISFQQNGVENLVLGDEVSFLSLGGGAPEVTEFYPIEAGIGDTVFIQGKNFSSLPEKNEVRFGQTYGTVVEASGGSLSVIVPTELEHKEETIAVSVYGNITYSIDKFVLAGPEAHDLFPEQGSEGTQIQIYGHNFVPFHTKVFVGTDSIIPHSIDHNFIGATIPANLKSGANEVRVKVFNESVTLQQQFYNLAPEIASFTPTSAAFGEEVTITGAGFSEDSWNTSVSVGGQYASIVSATQNEIKFLVPEGLFNKDNNISVYSNGFTTTADETLSLKAPEITSFSPEKGPAETLVTISGNNFSTSWWNNTYVFFGDVQASILSADHHTITAVVPASNATSLAVKVQVGEHVAIADKEFELAPHKILDFNPKHGTTGTVVTIIGENFVNNPASNEVRIGEFYCDVLNASSTEIEVRIAGEVTDAFGLTGQVSVNIGGQIEFSTESFKYTWVKKSFFTWSGRYDAISFSYDNKGYLGMGWQGGWAANDIYAFDPIDSWSFVTTYPGAQTGTLPVSFLIDDELFIYSRDHGLSLTECWKYNLVGNEWSMVTNPPVIMSEPVAFSMNGKGYVGLGTTAENNDFDKMFEYDPDQNEWTEFSGPPGGRRTGSIVMQVDGKTIVGLGEGNSGTIKDLYGFNASTKTWTSMGEFPGFSRTNATTFTLDNVAYVVGGYNNTDGADYLKDVWAYDAATDSWIQKSDFPGQRANAAAFVINGKAYVGTGFGGWTGGWEKNDLWEYHPENDQ